MIACEHAQRNRAQYVRQNVERKAAEAAKTMNFLTATAGVQAATRDSEMCLRTLRNQTTVAFEKRPRLP